MLKMEFSLSHLPSESTQTHIIAISEVSFLRDKIALLNHLPHTDRTRYRHFHEGLAHPNISSRFSFLGHASTFKLHPTVDGRWTLATMGGNTLGEQNEGEAGRKRRGERRRKGRLRRRQ